MSYDIYLRKLEPCATCGSFDEPGWLPDPTYNLTEIFDLALTGELLPNPAVPEVGVVLFHEKTDRPRGLRILSGRRAGDTILMLENALKRMKDSAWRDRFVALEPPNKWGDLKGAIEVVERLLDVSLRWPRGEWAIR